MIRANPHGILTDLAAALTFGSRPEFQNPSAGPGGIDASPESRPVLESALRDEELEGLLRRHRAFWDRTSVDRPLLNLASEDSGLQKGILRGISIPLADGTILCEQGEPITADRIDPRLILDIEEFPLRSGVASGARPLTAGDLFVTRAPWGKLPWVEAILGCPVVPRLDTGGIYSAPYLDAPGQIDAIPALEGNAWFSLLTEFTRALVADSRGSYQVVQCLQRGPIDLVSALLGHREMCLAFYDSPGELAALTERCTETFIAVAKAQQDLVPRLRGGVCNPFAVWSPGTVVRTQCDVVSSVSARHYEQLFFPYDVEICKAFDYSITHLHSGYLHHVDVLLKEKYPTAIQVSLDTGSTPFAVHDRLPVFARILEEKPLFIQGQMSKRELDELLERLPARGLYISPTRVTSD